MIIEKRLILKPILESNQGVHLTAYLINKGDVEDLKNQLNRVINEINEYLAKVMLIEEKKKFLEPLESLLADARIFSQMKGNIGIFRNKDSFQILNIPIEVEQFCQVASSFHVKPILRWVQGDRDFLFLGIENDEAHLYHGSQTSFNKIDTVFISDLIKLSSDASYSNGFNNVRDRRLEIHKTFSILANWISNLTKQSKPKLFVAGKPSRIQLLFKYLNYENAVKTPLSNSYINQDAINFCNDIRKILTDETRKSFEKSLLEFKIADKRNRVKKNIFQISKAVVQGRVRKLIVTDELSIFGKINTKTGGLAIHPFDLDHEDDCVLDDLAQMVLRKGGQVVIAKRNEIPMGRPVLAILDDELPSVEERKVLRFDILQERIG